MEKERGKKGGDGGRKDGSSTLKLHRFKPKEGKTNVRKEKSRNAVACDVYPQFRTRDLCMETHIQSRICACRDGRGMQGEDERRGGDNS